MNALQTAAVELAHAVNEHLETLKPDQVTLFARLANAALDAAGFPAMGLCAEEVERRKLMASVRSGLDTAEREHSRAVVLAFTPRRLRVVGECEL